MNYSNLAHRCRVDFFQSGGKWYTTEEFDFEGKWYNDPDLKKALATCLKQKFCGRYSGMTAVVLEPYHKNEHPQMLVNWDLHETY